MSRRARLLTVLAAAGLSWAGVVTILRLGDWWLASSLVAAAAYLILVSVIPLADREASTASLAPSAVRNPDDVVEADVIHLFRSER